MLTAIFKSLSAPHPLRLPFCNFFVLRAFLRYGFAKYRASIYSLRDQWLPFSQKYVNDVLVTFLPNHFHQKINIFSMLSFRQIACGGYFFTTFQNTIIFLDDRAERHSMTNHHWQRSCISSFGTDSRFRFSATTTDTNNCHKWRRWQKTTSQENVHDVIFMFQKIADNLYYLHNSDVSCVRFQLCGRSKNIYRVKKLRPLPRRPV